MDGVVAGSLGAPAWYDRQRVVQLVAFVAAVVGGIVMFLVPAYNTVSESSDGQAVESTRTLLEVNGPWMIGVALIPVVLAGIPLLLRERARAPISITTTVLLVAFVVVSGFTIGMFFFMAAICAVVALFVPATRRSGR